MSQSEPIEAQVLQVIEDDYHGRLEQYIKIFVSISGTSEFRNEIPPTVNNEIRNALNHLGRALASRSSPFDTNVTKLAITNIENARWHLLIAACDILNESISRLQADVDDAIRYMALIRYAVSQEIENAVHTCREDYLDVKAAILKTGLVIGNRQNDEIVSYLEDLLRRYLEVHKWLLGQLGEKAGLTRGARYMRMGYLRKLLFRGLQAAQDAVATWQWSSASFLLAFAVAVAGILALALVLVIVFGSFVTMISNGWPILLIAVLASLPLVIMFGVRRQSP